MDTFEYIVRESSQVRDIQIALNSLGKEGWELVCVVSGTFYFKRKKRI